MTILVGEGRLDMVWEGYLLPPGVRRASKGASGAAHE